MKKNLILFLSAPVVLIAIWILSAPVPSYRAERFFFGYALAPVQKIMGWSHERSGPYHGFSFEDPKNLVLFRTTFKLDQVVQGASNDFESTLRLMHWVRDRFPHAYPVHSPSSQSFDGVRVLREPHPGYLCGTAAQLLVQAVTSLGGTARRAELRFTPKDQHAVVEVWSAFYGKWFVADPDYDIYYTVHDIPQNALELHRIWVGAKWDDLAVHWRESPHNIYRADLEGTAIKEWDKMARFSVKLLNYYSHVSFPLRNDWLSRPLPWWHPDANHVTGSLVIQLPTMRNDEDFLLRIPADDGFYGPPITSLSEGR